MPDEAPSKMQLLERREERALVLEGRTVLEERRDLLAQLMLELIRQAEAEQARLDAVVESARRALRAAVIRHGFYGLRRFAAAQTSAEDPRWRLRNRFGTPWVEAVAGPPSQPELTLGEGWEISPELELAVVDFQRLLQRLRDYAAAQNNLLRLTAAFRRTQRRLNALDNIIVPELEASIRNLEAMLDEAERESLVRSLMIKRASAERF